jgi:hypothetical protein
MSQGLKCLKANGSYPETMSANLWEAHDLPVATLRDRNDETLERIYIDRRFIQKV